MEKIECAYNLDEIPNDNTLKEITPVTIAYVIGVGWQLTTTNDGAIYTPQSYEATFGVLPKLKLPKGHKYTRKQKREWYAHRREKKPFKGFKH
ncbi:MAG: hypothetical protein AAGH46_03440 [Bacteroidota bacterium]